MSAPIVSAAVCGGAVLIAGAVARPARSRRLPATAWWRSLGSAPRWTWVRSALIRNGTEASGGRGAIEVLRLRASIAAGASLLQAFEALGSAGGVWSQPARAIVERARAGQALHASIDGWSAAAADPAVGLLADSLALAHGTGGSQVRALDAALSTLRDRDALQREVRALASQARASAVVLVVTPVAFAVAVGLLDPRVRGVFASPVGLGCIVGGVGLDAVGAWWMSRLVGRVT